MFPPSLQSVVVPPTRSAELRIVELDEHQVRAKGTKIRRTGAAKKKAGWDCTFGRFSDTLKFDSWSLFHAAIKTELTASWTGSDVDRRSLGFALQHDDRLSWSTGTLCAAGAGPFDLEDFAAAGLAGRLGEAIAYLTMVHWGYVYWDRCAVVWQRAAQHARMTHAEQLRRATVVKRALRSSRPTSEPDFVFEKLSREVALMEAKGSVVNPATDRPTVKGDLAQALAQLDAWTGVITPKPKKSFAIGTYLRGEDDKSEDPSLIAFVDPPDSSPSTSGGVEPDGPESDAPMPAQGGTPSDVVRRCNYGAWLSGMGLVQSGSALRALREKPTARLSLPVVRVGNRDVAITVVGLRHRTGDLADLFLDPWGFPSPRWHRWLRNRQLVAIGLQVSVLNSLGVALRDLRARIEAPDDSEVDSSPTSDNLRYGSFMPDGSFVGLLDADLLEGAEEETFDL